MMAHEDGYFRGYVHLSAAWYAKDSRSFGTVDEIMIGLNHREGGTAGEFAIRWLEVGGRSVPRLEAFGDGWAALVQHFGDLLEVLGDGDYRMATPDQMCALLDALGIEDETPREAPAGYKSPARCRTCGQPVDSKEAR